MGFTHRRVCVESVHDALAAQRSGLLQPIDVSKLSNHAKLYDVAKDPLGGNIAVGYTFYATSIVYRSDKVTIKANPRGKGAMRL